MKKKILSILVAFIICLSPVLLLTGCGGKTDNGVAFPSGIEKGWSVKQNGKFSDCIWSGTGSITYTATTAKKTEGYSYNEKTGLYEKTDATIAVKEAISQGLLVCIGGFDSTGAPNSTFEMTLMFDGETIKVECKITSGETQPETQPETPSEG